MVSQEILHSFLDKVGVSYSHQTKKAINICCPYCDDEKYHCGIFMDNLRFSCWKCGEKGTLYELVKHISNLSYKEYISLLSTKEGEYDWSASIALSKVKKKDKEESKKPKIVEWPPPESASIRKVKESNFVLDFIVKRNLTVPFCIEKDIYIGLGGNLMNYFIIPITEHGKVVAYQGRHLFQDDSHKYHSVGDINKYLFNFDNVEKHRTVVITEGVFSCWACPNAVATFGSTISDVQIYKLYLLHPSEIVIAWDIGEDGTDAFWKGRKLVNTLSSFFNSIPVYYLLFPPGKDPADIGKEGMLKLIDSQRCYQNK